MKFSIFSSQSSLILSLFIIGFISMLGQVAVLRELSVAFYGVELIYILAMGIWLFWSALMFMGMRICSQSLVPAIRVFLRPPVTA